MTDTTTVTAERHAIDLVAAESVAMMAEIDRLRAKLVRLEADQRATWEWILTLHGRA